MTPQGAPQPPDMLLYEQARRSHEIVIQSIDSLDAKAGSVVNVAAILSGLILASGILAFRELWDPELESAAWLYPFGVFLATGIGASLAALLFGTLAWRRARIVIIDPRILTERYETRTEPELRRFLIVQLGEEFARMMEFRERTLEWLRMAFLALGISVVMLLIYAGVLLYVFVT